jgi:hypothetical protein
MTTTSTPNLIIIIISILLLVLQQTINVTFCKERNTDNDGVTMQTHQEIQTTIMATTTTTTTPEMSYETMDIEEQEAFKNEYFTSARKWDLGELKSCINRGIPVGVKNDVGWNALHFVVVGYLDPDPDDDDDDVPNDDALNDVVKYLVHECGIDINVLTNDGHSALHLAIGSEGYFHFVKCLIYECPTINVHLLNINGQNALHLLLSYKEGDYVDTNDQDDYIRMMKYLIDECNINIYAKDNKGRHSLNCACTYGHINMAKYLIDDFCYYNLREQDSKGFTALHAAV